ncbi:hypothetical protein ACFHW2_32645 [Actinomadura sp. LOL_016]|uniref:hypothetical protein n=1 Tax=unclassified Actinomadura TaxID=2626254 RepID=UPI003A800285
MAAHHLRGRGLAGASLARVLRRRLRTAVLLRCGLVVEALTHVGPALTERAWVAAIVLVVSGVHTMVWGRSRRPCAGGPLRIG